MDALPAFVVVIILVLGLILAILTALMPFFVFQINENVGKLLEITKNRENGSSELEAVADALRDVGRSQTEMITALADQQRTVSALVEQQRTINALRRRLDKLEGAAPNAPPQTSEEFTPGIPLEQAFDDLDEEATSENDEGDHLG